MKLRGSAAPWLALLFLNEDPPLGCLLASCTSGIECLSLPISFTNTSCFTFGTVMAGPGNWYKMLSHRNKLRVEMQMISLNLGGHSLPK